MVANRRSHASLTAALVLLVTAFGWPVAQAETVLVFAAASTNAALDEVGRLYSERGMGTVRASYAASSTLAQQIANGAPAQVFISAHARWMDHLAGKGAVVAASRVDLLTNRLVLIAPARSTWTLEVDPRFPLAARLGDGRLALGDPDHVPEGIYAKAALESLGVWADLAGRLAYGQDARAALAVVARGEAAAGVVYATDAAFSTTVRVVAEFPSSSHPPIVYPAALVTGGDGPEARRLFAFLTSAEARAVFRRHGFGTAGGER